MSETINDAAIKPPWFAQALNRRAEVEQWLFDAASGRRALPTAEECRALAIKLGVPDEWRSKETGPA